ncbi:MAG: tRNA preQ1(34) S-adenosylmethionine ribosyltransferase-isomerase QueA [Desulfobacterota bacterium]|nr:tRNA preQ1(34) S-adenosylmethionine ribosyltransferase-isomerase QueA [Thermodesulfobacteriota bacterium]
MNGLLSDYDFDLPPDRIAQEPGPERDHSRLLVLHRRSGDREHRFFQEVAAYFEPGDVLVINDTRVVPVKLIGQKATGARVECLILNYPETDPAETWTSTCLLRGARRFNPGDRMTFGEDLAGEILPSLPNGHRVVRFHFRGSFQQLLESRGRVPLPPYIHRKGQTVEQERRDRERYQTVYAARPGAVAAPTAGLHFTDRLLSRLGDLGVITAPVTLHVGYGTFAPVKGEDPAAHRMHPETYRLPEETVRIIREQKRAGKRIWAVGTTSVRVLEYVAGRYGELTPSAGQCDLFIRPGFEFRVVDRLITNFHLPKTTLILLVAALAGRENILGSYREAIERGYRFYSYGDAMLII